MSQNKQCPCGCGYELTGGEVVCAGTVRMTSPATQANMRNWRDLGILIPRETRGYLLDLARTVRSQRPKPAKQDELFALPAGAMNGRMK